MNYSLSVERIVRALNSSNCICEENNIIKILKNIDYQAYQENTMRLIDEEESLNDFIKIIEAMKSEIPFSRYKKETFDQYLKTIKY